MPVLSQSNFGIVRAKYAEFTPATLWLLWTTSGSRKFAGFFLFFLIEAVRWGGNKQLERRKLEKKWCPGWGRTCYSDVVRQLFSISSCCETQAEGQKLQNRTQLATFVPQVLPTWQNTSSTHLRGECAIWILEKDTFLAKTWQYIVLWWQILCWHYGSLVLMWHFKGCE